MLTLRHMRYFVALSEELHFGRAATRLHMTQPALSQQIQQLERIVQVPLLYRNNRMVELTSAGSAFLGQARRVLAAADRAIEVAHEAATSVGLLRVGYSSTMDWLFIPQLTDAVARSTANVVWRSLTEEISNRDILDRRFDVAVTRHFERTDGVEHEVVLWERPGLYVNADDPLAALDEIQFSCLEGRRVRSLFPSCAATPCCAPRGSGQSGRPPRTRSHPRLFASADRARDLQRHVCGHRLRHCIDGVSRHRRGPDVA